MPKKVVVGMSGGVDSAVTALLLKKQGYDVIGVTMKLWEGESDREDGCCSVQSSFDARKVCDQLEIPFYVANFKESFNEKVIEYFVEEYFQGRTPNPCIACNKHLKFNDLLILADKIGADYIATGHYAKVEYDERLQKYLLKKSVTAKKDQTYVLYCLTQEQLARTLMPLGNYTKEEVRKIAEENNLKVAKKPESQEICFIEDDDYGRFLNEKRPDKAVSGFFIDQNGKRIASHKGIINYTIGQRKGLGIALGRPVFVTKINPIDNSVSLGENDDLMKTELFADDLNLTFMESLNTEIRIDAKIRYSAKESPAILIPEKNGVKVIFDTPQRAITPGQAVVFYINDVIIGGATIKQVY